MRTVKCSALVLLISLVPACGSQLVEFGGPEDTNPDASLDGGDASPDTNQPGNDAGDANPDAQDASLDAHDATPDSHDATADVTEAGEDATPDVTEAGEDAAPDVTEAGLEAGDAAPPTVLSTVPSNGATILSLRKNLTATFSEPMTPATIDGTTFVVKQGVTPLLGAVSYVGVGTFGLFIQGTDFAPGKTYTATITTGVKDLADQAMVNDYVLTFTTSACGQAPITLGAAGTFVVLAGSTVTSTGPTSVTGDLGVSPGTAVDGFPPGIIVGAKHAGDPTSAQAIADLTTAYNEAAGRTLCPVSVAGNIGGQTLAPGLYKSTSSLAVSSGDLTLDAQGDGDAVFIFQMASTLTTTAGRQVMLIGGAKSTNVYWQVGTSATLGSTSAFQGTIMADQAITFSTGATLNGRALARIAAVTLDSNTIVKPSP